MAETTGPAGTGPATDAKASASGQHDPASAANVASKDEKAAQDNPNARDDGLTEGELRALRHAAGLNQHAGHEGDVLGWETSAAGKAYKDGEKDRQKAIKDEEKAAKESEKENEAAVKKYREALDKG